jgi:hypothetical protein
MSRSKNGSNFTLSLTFDTLLFPDFSGNNSAMLNRQQIKESKGAINKTNEFFKCINIRVELRS